MLWKLVHEVAAANAREDYSGYILQVRWTTL